MVLGEPRGDLGWELIVGVGRGAGDEGAVGAASAFEGQDVAVGLAVGTVALFANVVVVEV